MAIQTLYRYLVHDVVPPPVVGLSPHVVMKSNLRLLMERLRSTSESSPLAAGEVGKAPPAPRAR